MSFVQTRLIIGGLLFLYFLTTLFLSIPFAWNTHVFVSPDEHATFTFTQAIVEQGVPMLSEPLNSVLSGILHPRSVLTVGTSLVPASFLGMSYLVGGISMISSQLTFLFTPFLSLLALSALGSLLYKCTDDKRLALLSLFLLAIHPAWWLYTSRTLMPNIPFVAFLLFALWIAVTAYRVSIVRHRMLLWALSGFCVGMALFIRAAELWWILPTVLVLVIIALRKTWMSWRDLLASGIGFGVMILFMLGANGMTYGNPFTTGYTVGQQLWQPVVQEAGVSPDTTQSIDYWQTVSELFFPFGIHLRSTLRHIFFYAFLLYPWMTIPALFGSMLVLSTWKKQSFFWKAWTISSTLISSYLFVLYGSWLFHDNPDPRAISLGNSYVRYWLPLFVLATPFAAQACVWIVDRASMLVKKERSDRARQIVLACLCVLTLILSGRLVFWGADGIFASRAALASFQEKQEAILAATENDAIIIVDRADKYLWPDRRVVAPLRSDVTYEAIPIMMQNAPTYYFGITLPEKDLRYLKEIKLIGEGLQFVPVITLQDETLYRIEYVESVQK